MGWLERVGGSRAGVRRRGVVPFGWPPLLLRTARFACCRRYPCKGCAAPEVAGSGSASRFDPGPQAVERTFLPGGTQFWLRSCLLTLRLCIRSRLVVRWVLVLRC